MEKKEFYQYSMKEQLANAKVAYIISVKSTARYDLYAVYLLQPHDQRLHVLWPRDGEKLLEGQVHSKNLNLPAYHFKFDLMGGSRLNELKEVLKKENPDIQVLFLGGAIPSNVG